MTTLPRSRTWIRAAALLAACGSVMVLALSAGLPADDAVAQAAAKKDEPWPINDSVDDPAIWGKAFPLHYELYRKSVDMERTKYGGSEAVPRTPTQADPRSVVSASKASSPCAIRASSQRWPWSIFRCRQRHSHPRQR